MAKPIRIIQHGLGPIGSGVARAVRRVTEAAPGLVTMRDLPIVTYR
jgi:hypothetical protein